MATTTRTSRRKAYARFLRYDLAQDLRQAGRINASTDAVACAKLINTGRKDKNLAEYLKTFRVPKLKRDGERKAAAHLLRCARIVGRST